MTRLPLHVDFYEIDLTKPVEINVPLHFVGKAKGLSEGGIVSPVVREIGVSCLPTAIPEFIEVDVSALGVGDSLHLDDITLPSGIEKLSTDNFTVVTCTFIKEEVAAPAADPAAPVAEPEVMAKGKKDEEGKPVAAAAKAADPAKGGDKK
jgi:large subunit ribosomal protein L25